MSAERSPHSELVAAIRAELFERADIPSDAPAYIERDQAQINAAHDALDGLVEQLEAQKRRADDLEESYRELHRQWSDLADERDRLRVMLDAVLPEKTTFHVIEGTMPGQHIPIRPEEKERPS